MWGREALVCVLCLKSRFETVLWAKNPLEGTFLHKQTKGSVEVTEWKGDSGQTLWILLPAICQALKIAAGIKHVRRGQAACAPKATGLESSALRHQGLKPPFHSELSLKFYVRSLNRSHQIYWKSVAPFGKQEGDPISGACSNILVDQKLRQMQHCIPLDMHHPFFAHILSVSFFACFYMLYL